MTNPHDLIGTSAAAEILTVSRQTIVDWAKRGDLIVASLTIGGNRRFRRSDVEALRDRMAVAAQPDGIDAA